MAVSVDIKPLAELLDGGFSKSSIRKAFSRYLSNMPRRLPSESSQWILVAERFS